MKIKQDTYRRDILSSLVSKNKTASQVSEDFGIALPLRKSSRVIDRALAYYFKRGWISREKRAIRFGIKRASGEHIHEWEYSITPAGRALLDYLDKLDNLEMGKVAYISIKQGVTDDYLRGFFDGDGCLSVNRIGNSYRASLSIANTCISLMEIIFEYLKDRGFNPKIQYRAPGKENYKPYVVINLSRLESIEHWFASIGSCHPDKLKKWEELKAIKANSKYPRYRKCASQ